MHLSRGLNVILFVFPLICLAACSSLPQIPTLQELVSADSKPTDPPARETPDEPARKETRSAYSLQLVALKYVNAQHLQPIVAHLSSGKGSTYVAGAHNAIMVGGSEEERANLCHTIAAFDVEALKGMPFALFPLNHSDADVVTEELWDLLGTPKGPFGKYIQLMAFKKQGAILVVSSQQHYIQEVGDWIAKMDVKDSPKERKVWVYHVKNERATEIDRPLQRIISEASGAPLTEDDLPRLATAPSPNSPFVAEETEDGIPLPPTPASIDRRMQDITTHSAPRVVADDTTNSIIVWGNQVELVLVRDALNKLDRVPSVVRIDAVLAEISFDKRNASTHDLDAIKRKLAFGHGQSNEDGRRMGDGLVTKKTETEILEKLAEGAELRVISSPHFKTKDGQTAEFRMADTVFATPDVDGDALTLKLGQEPGTTDTVLAVHEGETLIYMAAPRAEISSLSGQVPGQNKGPKNRGQITKTVILLTPHILEPENGDVSASYDNGLKMSALSSPTTLHP